MHSHVDYSSDYDKYNRLLREVQTPLYPGSEHNVLGTVMEQMKIKNKRGKSNVCFDKDIALMKKVFPKGPYSPGKCLDVYMRPLIDELQELWENGLLTFDRHDQTSFMMKTAVIWTISAAGVMGKWTPYF
ncbi:hypothetical protein ACLB2K_009105 [Fragaria x ananassa]